MVANGTPYAFGEDMLDGGWVGGDMVVCPNINATQDFDPQIINTLAPILRFWPTPKPGMTAVWTTAQSASEQNRLKKSTREYTDKIHRFYVPGHGHNHPHWKAPMCTNAYELVQFQTNLALFLDRTINGIGEWEKIDKVLDNIGDYSFCAMAKTRQNQVELASR